MTGGFGCSLVLCLRKHIGDLAAQIEVIAARIRWWGDKFNEVNFGDVTNLVLTRCNGAAHELERVQIIEWFSVQTICHDIAIVMGDLAAVKGSVIAIGCDYFDCVVGRCK